MSNTKAHTLRQLNILHILNDGFTTGLPLLLPFIALEFDANLTQIGILGSVLGAFMVILAIPSGYLAARIGSLTTLSLTVGLYALGFATNGLAPSMVLVTAAFFISSIGFGLFHPVGFALVAKLAQKKERGRLMANFTAVGDLGRIAFSSAIPYVASSIGWRITSFACSIFAAAAFIYTFRSHQGEKKPKAPHPDHAISFASFLKNHGFLYSLIAGALDALASSSLFLFLPFLLMYRGLDVAHVGFFSALFFVGNFAGKSLLGRLVDHYGSKRVFIGSEMGMALFIFLLAITQSFVVIGILALILGAFTKGTAPVVQTMITETVSHHHEKDESVYNKAFGIKGTATGIATTIGPLLLGYIADQTTVAMAFTASGVIALIAVIPSLAIKSS